MFVFHDSSDWITSYEEGEIVPASTFSQLCQRNGDKVREKEREEKRKQEGKRVIYDPDD